MSGYKINGVNLDDLFEPRNGRTPFGPLTGFKVNGVDLNQRYLSITHPDAIIGPSRDSYKVTTSSVPIGNVFAGKDNQGDMYLYFYDEIRPVGKPSDPRHRVGVFEIIFSSPEIMDNFFIFGGRIRATINYTFNTEWPPGTIGYDRAISLMNISNLPPGSGNSTKRDLRYYSRVDRVLYTDLISTYTVMEDAVDSYGQYNKCRVRKSSDRRLEFELSIDNVIPNLADGFGYYRCGLHAQFVNYPGYVEPTFNVVLPF